MPAGRNFMWPPGFIVRMKALINLNDPGDT
jgi:hypothetical protein